MSLPILTYHSLDTAGSVISTHPDQFRAQMRQLHETGWRVISLGELIRLLQDRQPLPPRTAVITFDDGYRNLYELAWPVLREHGFPATVFVVADRCGDDNYWPGQPTAIPRFELLDVPEMIEMSRHGIEFGSHSLTHPDLARLNAAEATREIVESQRILQDRLGQAVRYFCYPYGRSTPAVRELVRQHYAAGCSTELGLVRAGCDCHWLPRVDMYYCAGNQRFAELGRPGFARYLAGRHALRVARRYVRPAAPTALPLRAWPVVGQLPTFLRDKLGFLRRCAALPGDVVELDIGGPTFLLKNPDDIKHVLETNHAQYTKTPRLTSPRGKWLSGDGLLTSSGAQHLTQRRMLQPVFHHHAVAPFGDWMRQNADAMMTQWADGSERDIHAEMLNLAQRNIGQILFGVDLFGGATELGAALRQRRRYMEYWFASLFPWPERLPSRINREYRDVMRVVDREIYGMIRARREASTPPADLLTMLMQATYKDGSVMSDRQVRDEAMVLAITGYETIGEALTWTWYLLARHPEAAERVRAEAPADPTVADLPRLRYTEAVVSEAMRLFPPTWIYIRMAQQTDRLPSGQTIPGGAKLYLSPYVLHHDARFFPQPGRFNPDRFLTPAAGRPKFAYFPFGGGPRVCIGQGLAMMELILTVARVATRYRLALVNDAPVTPEPGITLHPQNGMRMRCNRLSP